MSLSEDLAELQQALELRLGERDRVSQQLEALAVQLKDPDAPTVGRLLSSQEKLQTSHDRLLGEIAAIEARIEILGDRVAAADLAAQVAALEATVAQAQSKVAPYMERIAQKAAELKAEIEQLYEAGLPGNQAAAKIYLVTGGKMRVRPVLVLALLEGFKYYNLPKLHQITEPGIVLHDADYVLYGEPMLPPWRKPVEPVAVEPEQAEDQAIAS
jgi:hypothetical protein